MVSTSVSTSELAEVEEQIESIEREIDYLITKKQKLLERRNLIQTRVQSLDNSRDAASAGHTLAGSSSIDWESGRYPWTDQLYSSLSSNFLLKSFRPLQLSCINATLSKRDVILIMPTGGGKSLCYQLPAVISEGFTLVISPLVSLMEDQLRSVERLGIGSHMLNAASSRAHVNEVHSNMVDKNNKSLKLVYVTPEKVSKSKRFISKLEKAYKEGRLARIVIDEVHCASQWGHDFRPDYKILGILKRQFPSTPIMGLTATATVKVLDDCKTLLRLDSCMVFKASYNRPNLFYEVRDKPTSYKEQVNDIVNLIQQKFTGQSGIVYCFSQKESEEICTSLNLSAIHTGCYHAGMSPSDRTQTHMDWISNKIQVIVATVAFGMGIDKGDVRFVIHHSISKSVENYYQESGRAGRDGKPAVCILYYRIADMFRQSTMVQAEYTGIQNLYAMIKYCINQSKCRRYMVAHHFGEIWKGEDCGKMCDICITSDGTTESSKEDVTFICEGFLEILDDTKSHDQRVTAAKLVDLWKSSSAAKNLSNEKQAKKKLEFVLAHCLLEDIVREDYHFTVYSTISYIVPGVRAAAIKSRRMSVQVETVSDSQSNINLKYPMDRVFETSSTSLSSGTCTDKETCVVEVEAPAGTSLEQPVSIISSSSGSGNDSDDAVMNDKGVSKWLSPTDQEDQLALPRPKRRHSISGFSEVDEDFVVTPSRRPRLTESRSLSRSTVPKSKKKSASRLSLSSSQSKLSFLSTGKNLSSSKVAHQDQSHQLNSAVLDHTVIEIESDQSN